MKQHNIDNIYIEPLKSVSAPSGAWYKVIRFLGKGGNGTSFLVLCTEGRYCGCIFTLKVLHKISDPARIDKFLQEVQFMKDNPYPTILKPYDEGTWNAHPFVIVDYLPVTLEDELRKDDISQKLLYALHLLSALRHLHGLGYIHRDIKPANIFIRDNVAVLADYGLVKKNDDLDPEDPENFKGYAAIPFFYRTPELVAYAKSEGTLCYESDIFHLGLVLAELFSGVNPLKPAELITDPIFLLSWPAPKGLIGNRLKWTILKMLNKDKEKRYSIEKCFEQFQSIFEQYTAEQIKLNEEA